MIIIVLILISWILQSFADAMLFGKAESKWAFELWHIVTALSLLVIYVPLMYLVKVLWYWYLIMPFVLMASHEIMYRVFKKINVAEWDDKFKCKFI